MTSETDPDVNPQNRPVFIIGAPRSGTSMLHWALLQHENLWGSAESDFLIDIVEGTRQAFKTGTQYGEHHWLIKEGVSRDEFFRCAGQGIAALYTSRSGGLRWVEQTPQYVLHYAGLNALFPGSRFIHIVRDGRQVVCSMQEKFGWSFLKAVNSWKQLVAAGSRAAEQADNVLQLKYEDVVKEPARSFQSIYEFIDEPFEVQSVEFLEAPINSSPGRGSESSSDKLIPRWTEWGALKRGLFKAHCGSLMKSLGYEL
jgi:hypothetical protein